MSIFFRIILIVVSIFFFTYVIRKIRKSQLQIEYAIFWVILSLLFILFSIFPQVVQWLTTICGMVAQVNFLFLTMIFILLVKVFIMSIRLGQLEEKIKNLTQQIAIQNHDIKEDVLNVERINDETKKTKLK